MSGSGSSWRGARHGGYAANSFRTEAIVLRTHRLGEADRIIEALTPEHGLVRAVAKGVRKTSSRLGSVVEPFMHSTLQLARGRGELHTVSQAQLLHPYATMLAADYDAYTVAGALAEAVERVPAVDDDGRGLSEDERAKVARRGQRLDESKPGSGLGLSIVTDLAGLYGGKLTLSDAPIGGLRAELVLPAV